MTATERVGYLLSDQAARTPDRELFVFEGRRVSYGEFDAWVTTVASDLVRRGVRRGDRVMVQLPNCLEALVLQVAAFRIGAIDMPVIPIYREHEVRQIVAESRPAVIAAAAQLGSRQPAAELDGICAGLGHEPAVRYLTGGERPGWLPVPGPGDVAGTELPEPLPADEPALLLYTSGTTSAPKGALLTSAALIAHLRNFRVALDVDQDCVILCATPVSHLGGFVAGVISENAAFGSTQVKYAMNGGDPVDAQEALRTGLVDEVVPVGRLRESALRLARRIAERGAELTTVLKEVALRASTMDHIGATAYELRVTHDLLQRGLFTRQLDDGLKRLRAGQSRATERLGGAG